MTLLSFSFVLFFPSQSFGKTPGLWDHLSPHPDYPIEWWYMTGFLTSDSGRHFGFQATFFRTKAKKGPTGAMESRKSPWTPRQIFGFHGAVSDLDRKVFRMTERERRNFSRSVLAQKDPFSVRIGRNRLDHPTRQAPSLDLFFRVGNQSFALALTPQSPPVWHDEKKKFYTGPNSTDWAYYYSYPLVRITGTRTVVLPNGTAKSEKVHGQCWFDHEWMRQPMTKDQIGWIWIWGWNPSNTQGVMLYQMIDRGVRLSSFHRATLLHRSGDAWTVRRTNAVHLMTGLVGSCLSLNDLTFLVDKKIVVEAHPWMDNQLLTGGVTYWEGASKIKLGDPSLLENGEGYLEVTGLGAWKNGRLCRNITRGARKN